MKTNTLFVLLFFATIPLHAEETTSLVGFKKETKLSPFVKGSEFVKKGPLFIGGGDPIANFKIEVDLEDEFVEGLRNAKAGCNRDALSTSLENNSLGIINAPLIKFQCDAIAKLEKSRELTPDVCLNLAGCLKNKIDYRSREASLAFKKARLQVAKEAIALTSKSGINQIIDYETLRIYASNKYGPEFIPESCKQDVLDIPESDGKKCNTQVIDEGYALAQNSCRIPEMGCNFEYLEYVKKTPRSEAPSNSQLKGYIIDLSHQRAGDTMIRDTDILNKIALILADSSLTPEKRVALTMDHIYANYMSADPVLRNYYDRSVINKANLGKDPIAEGLLSYIKNNEHKNSLQILVDLENLRKSEAKSILEQKCGKINTMAKLCQAVDEISIGTTVAVEKKEFDKMLSRKPSFNNALINYEELTNNVARCNTFNLFTSKEGILQTEIDLSMGQDLLTDANGASFKQDLLKSNKKQTIVIDSNGTVTKSDKDLNLISSKGFSESREKEKGNDLLLVRSFSRNVALPEVYKKGIDGENGSSHKASASKSDSVDSGVRTSSHSSDSEALKSAMDSYSLAQKSNMMIGAKSQGAQIPAQQVINDPNGFIASSGKLAEPAKELDSNKTQYNQMIGKISDLEERLAKAQKRASEGEKIPEEKKETASASSGDNENSLIAELKSARNALVEMNKKKVEDQEAKAVAAQKTVGGGNYRPEQDEYYSDESRENYRERESSAQTASASRSSGASRSVAGRDSSPERGDEGGGSVSRGPSSINRGSSDDGDRSDAIVLTKMDGVTNAKMNQTIKDLIYAESGKPFYIEENGMVKQIIPEVVDGKILLNEDGTPVYKTVVKGKVGEFKVDVKKEKDKKVAKQDSAADVKKSDEKAAPAVRYRDLKDIIKRTTKVE
nr:hypothetical protein BHI3_10390 [Bacteriovorax sp. HI3]